MHVHTHTHSHTPIHNHPHPHTHANTCTHGDNIQTALYIASENGQTAVVQLLLTLLADVSISDEVSQQLCVVYKLRPSNQ